MNGSLSHRGPDASGVFEDGKVSMGHTLLAIRGDVEDSRQPFTKDGSPWVLTYNGQLYDTGRIRSKLGPEFRDTELDTALLFGLVEKCGWDFIRHAHGMFAIALYHSGVGEVRLYRDPSGQKPLYYYRKGKDFSWSSEIKALSKEFSCDRTVDTTAVRLAANLGFVPGDRTILAYVRKVRVGEVVRFRMGDGALERERFGCETAGYYPDDFGASVGQLVKEHLQSRARVAINLSGGLDSSILLHEMASATGEVRTYSTRFIGASQRFNEDADIAKRLSETYGTDHMEIPITREAFIGSMADAFRAVEEPNYNISLPTVMLTAGREGAAGEEERVVLSGDGGDEVFGGYDHYFEARKYGRLMRLMTPAVFNFLKNLRNGTAYRHDVPEEMWLSFRRIANRYLTEEEDHLTNELRAVTEPYIGSYCRKRGDDVYAMMAIGRVLWMASENFIRSDKVFMRHSMEVRSPFSYHPFRSHMDAYLGPKDYLGARENKIRLREYCRGRLPDFVVNRLTKTGWTSPVAEWYDGDFKAAVLDMLRSPEGEQDLVDWRALRRQVEGSDVWPGKHLNVYLSLSVLAEEFGLSL